MKYLTQVVLLCVLLPLSNAACYRTLMNPDATHCQDAIDKTWHAVGSNWRNSICMDCTCDECCTAYYTPRQFPADCVSVFDSKECKYNVHKRDNPAVQCPIFSAVGK